jgi:hypothetical protein
VKEEGKAQLLTVQVSAGLKVIGYAFFSKEFLFVADFAIIQYKDIYKSSHHP